MKQNHIKITTASKYASMARRYVRAPKHDQRDDVMSKAWFDQLREQVIYCVVGHDPNGTR